MTDTTTVEDGSNLYFLVRKGTNVRVLTKDEQPLILADPSMLASEAEKFEGFLRLGRGEIEPMSVREYLEKFWVPIKVLKDQLNRETDQLNKD